MNDTWRDYFAPIIADVIARVGRDDPDALRTALREAWRWGPRLHWPYKVWRHEIRRQVGTFGPPGDRLTLDLFD